MNGEKLVLRHVTPHARAIARALRRFPSGRGVVAQVNVNARRRLPYTARLVDDRRRPLGTFGAFASVADAFAALVAPARRIIADRNR